MVSFAVSFSVWVFFFFFFSIVFKNFTMVYLAMLIIGNLGKMKTK